jgi:hypothetical protein
MSNPTNGLSPQFAVVKSSRIFVEILWIVEYLDSPGKVETVLGKIDFTLGRIPIELQACLQKHSTGYQYQHQEHSDFVGSAGRLSL